MYVSFLDDKMWMKLGELAPAFTIDIVFVIPRSPEDEEFDGNEDGDGA
jgi:hypothetical protein